MKKLNRYWIAALIMSMLLILQCTSNNNKSLNLKLTKMAEDLNLSSPTVLDQHTRFDSAIVTPENIFQYYYTIIYANNPSELLSNQKKELINNMKKAFTTDRSLQVFKDNKVTIQYIYKDTAQNIIDIITIDSEAYN
ncbi:MAG: hypothetical protein PHO84_02630 [Dysgonamonadaceae bacterium]|jgi:hypothetical protein|nr:hypothetical protein [Dysgonamonadaceae bacterium]MDD3356076.1 hypothetical protein [Dysgonamonadaceae bacterium]MDD3728136.1 hypothetical protein [Dysgonamonadaceae bacterium]MDD4246030.1 hypothetical protein [Dysgonamonadaceae bacterium]HUI33057.1 hypothetical protein [Dysgonamonadaceae bacterium]